MAIVDTFFTQMEEKQLQALYCTQKVKGFSTSLWAVLKTKWTQVPPCQSFWGWTSYYREGLLTSLMSLHLSCMIWHCSRVFSLCFIRSRMLPLSIYAPRDGILEMKCHLFFNLFKFCITYTIFVILKDLESQESHTWLYKQRVVLWRDRSYRLHHHNYLCTVCTELLKILTYFTYTFHTHMFMTFKLKLFKITVLLVLLTCIMRKILSLKINVSLWPSSRTANFSLKI